MSDQKTDETKFDLSEVEKTFTQYKINEIFDGVVVSKNEDGVIFNIGGKLDGFIPKSDFEDYSLIKFGDRFKVVVTNPRNEEGMIELSKTKADNLISGTMQAEKLKMGTNFTFVVTSFSNKGLCSKMGEYEIFVPTDEILNKPYKSLSQFLHGKYDAIVTNVDSKNKVITASIKMLSERTQKNAELSFWNSVFVNKLVLGKITKIMPYGCFVNVNGITCFCHISEISHQFVSDISKVLEIGKEYTFKIIEIDRENKKVALSYKALQKSPKENFLKTIKLGQELNVTVSRFLPFGAIVKDTQSGFEGLLHINDASLQSGSQIKDIIKFGENLVVIVKSVDEQKQKVSFELKDKR